jgi:ankyrin repeat protein
MNCFLHALKKLICSLLLGAGMLTTAQAGSYDDFFTAIKRDDAQTVLALLQKGFDTNTLSPKHQHGLYEALQESSLKVIQIFLDWPATDVNVLNDKGESALMIAAIRGHTTLVGKLIQRGADVNKTGWAPLHYAASSGQLEIMRILLKHHAYIDAESPNGTTPLMMAAMYGTPEAVKLLIAEGADPNLKNELNLTALQFAQRANRQDIANAIAAAIRSQSPQAAW